MKLVVFPGRSLPEPYRTQILDLLRAEWPEDFAGANRNRDWIHRAHHHPIHVVLVERGRVLAHAGVLWKTLEHVGEGFKTYGLSEVVVRPEFRGSGLGERVVRAATDWVRASDGDIGLFKCPPERCAFYARLGWIPMAETRIAAGTPCDPMVNDEQTMMGFFSDRGRRARPAFEGSTICFGEAPW